MENGGISTQVEIPPLFCRCASFWWEVVGSGPIRARPFANKLRRAFLCVILDQENFTHPVSRLKNHWQVNASPATFGVDNITHAKGNGHRDSLAAAILCTRHQQIGAKYLTG